MENKTEPSTNNSSTVPTSNTASHQAANALAPADKTCFASKDEQFVVSQLVKTAKRYPPSSYPCIVLTVKPQSHTRVRDLADGRVEIMPTFLEMEELLDAMNDAALASGKGKLYEVIQRIPEKSRERKALWKQRNETRVKQQLKPSSWHGKKRWNKN